MRTTDDFRNEPFLDFSDPEINAAQKAALEKVQGELGQTYPLLIGGKKIETGDTFATVNPADHSEVLGYFQNGTKEHAEAAIQDAARAFETWKNTSAQERADIAFNAANIMREKRYEINAWMILESGKSWAEADGDTAEAIDFLDFYGLEMLRYGSKQPITPTTGEDNEVFFVPLGVGAIIPPWNFPNAIPCGMTAAAWVTGNTAVLKPAPSTPLTAWKMFEIVREAGLPDGVVNFITGPDEVVGNHIVESPDIRFISFTGSKAVGLMITEKAAKRIEGQRWVKRVVTEMGGKDGIIVDAEADIDSAVAGTLASAFGFQGQKCSACSRVIVDAAVHDEFVEKLTKAIGGITQGDPRLHENYMGPVINTKAFEKITSYLDIGRSEGILAAGGKADDSKGWFVEPTLFVGIKPEDRLSLEEIFGPVLAVIKSDNFDHALKIANNTEYGLTGAVYSANQEKLARARREFHVGNLYFNRKCTGALVGAHPFGGFNMSGTDSKAGGREYLLHFMQAKLVSAKVG